MAIGLVFFSIYAYVVLTVGNSASLYVMYNVKDFVVGSMVDTKMGIHYGRLLCHDDLYK